MNATNTNSNTTDTIESFAPYLGTEGFKVGDKVEFILSPEHIWFKNVPMAVATISEVISLEEMGEEALVFDTLTESGNQVYIVTTTEFGSWASLIRRVPEDTEENLAKIVSYADNPKGLVALMDLHVNTAGVLEVLAGEAMNKVLESLAQQLEEDVKH